MLNYVVDPETLLPHVPFGTTLDTYQGHAYVSMVGFLFLKTRVLGWPIPFHQNFEEVNLRFYVRRLAADGWRRGVVFIKEIVPRPAIALVARVCYNENYVALPMRHRLELGGPGSGVSVEYAWQSKHRWNSLRVKTTGELQPVAPGSLAGFITEHYWGYATQRNGGCVEYKVEHPPWRVWVAGEVAFECDVAELYGEKFAKPLRADPGSAFLAEGSVVTVFKGAKVQGVAL